MDLYMVVSSPFVLDYHEIENMFLKGLDRFIGGMVVLSWNKCSQSNMLSLPHTFSDAPSAQRSGFSSLSLPTAGGGRTGKASFLIASTSPILSKNKLTRRDTQCRLFIGGTLS